jgi:selenocysteine lyase/cysteine desulfurase
MTELNIDFVRSQFPAFRVPELAEKSFFENAGGSFAAGAVISRLNRFYTSRKVQPYASYEASSLGGQEMDEARKGLAALLSIAPSTLHFGPSTSQNTYVLAQAFKNMNSKRNVVIVTNQDHEANSGSWRRLERSGFEIKEWKVNSDTGSLNVNDLKDLLDENVLLLAFPHCSNIVGEINPVKEVCKVVRNVGAFTCVDGVSYAPHGFSDLEDLAPDIYLFSTYKTYGTHLGVMYISDELNKNLENQGHYFNEASPLARFTPAGPDHAQIAAAAGIVDYIHDVHTHHFDQRSNSRVVARRVHEMQRKHETKLLEPLLDYLRNRTDLRILGSNSVDGRVPTVALDIKERGKKIAKNLAQDGIMADCGDFYAVRLLEALGVDLNHGVLRLSFVHYTSEQDVENLIKSLAKNL